MQRSSLIANKVFSPYLKVSSARTFSSASTQNSNTKSKADNNSKNLSMLLDEQCNKLQHKDALRVPHQNLRWTYTELQNWVDAAANGFLNNSYKKGASIVSFLGNDTESVAMNLAASKVGVNVVNVQPGSMDELASSLEKVKPQGLVMMLGDKEKESIIELIPELDRASHGSFRSKRFPFLHQVINTHFHNIVEDATFYREFHQPDQVPNAAANLAKSIPTDSVVSSFLDRSQQKKMTQKELSDMAYSVGEKIGLGFNERVCSVLPLSSVAGQVLVWSTFLNSSFLVLPSSSFDVSSTYEAINKEHCTVLVATAEQIESLANASDKIKKSNHLSTLKKVLVVSEGGNVSNAADSIRKLGVKEVYTYNNGQVDRS